ncbi:hypothetical protein GGR53DRAFT_451511 [Hypoxylon sp. FL1150]|nr:hypothetical protein GGR53DRAFT_451511 [Hypoxylon sp. FL1150]
MYILHARLSVLPSDDLSTFPPNRVEIGLVPPNSDGWKVIISGIVLTLLTVLLTLLRLWSLRQDGRAFTIEDGFHLGAVLFFFGLVSVDFVMVFVGGVGHHINSLQDWHLIQLMKAGYARHFIYVATIGLIKMNIILMFMRIFFARQFKPPIVAATTFTVVCVLSTVMANLLICRPISLNWHVLQGSKDVCGDQDAAFLVIGIIDIINQLAILSLPFPIMRLGMETRYKVMTAFIFVFGIVSLAFGITRLFILPRIDNTDLPVAMVPTTIYGVSEAGIAIMVSSCPLLQPVLDRLLSISLMPGSSGWKDKNIETATTSRRRRKSIKSSGFTQMGNDSREDLGLELGNMGAHRSKRDTSVTVGRRPPFSDEDDGRSMHRIVVTSETIVVRNTGEL